MPRGETTPFCQMVQNPATRVLRARCSIAQRALPLSAFGVTRGHHRNEASAVQMCAGSTVSIRAKPPPANIRYKEPGERVHTRLQTPQYLQRESQSQRFRLGCSWARGH